MDRLTGLQFQAERGPASTLASPCIITDITKIIAEGKPRPYLLPLGDKSVNQYAGQVELSLVEGSEIFDVLEEIGSPLTEFRLRFTNVVVMSDGELELRQTIEDVDDLYEIPCSIENGVLYCSPWPEISSTVDNYRFSSLSIVFTAPLTQNIAASQWLSADNLGSLHINGTIVHTLDQEFEFFQNIQVNSWFPNGDFLETIEEIITIQGQYFIDSTRLKCLFFEPGAGLVPIANLPAFYISDTEIQCDLPPNLFRQVSETFTLHLSLDEGLTYEVMNPADTEITQSLRRAPHFSGLYAYNEIGLPATLSILIGRTSILTLYMKGIHLLNAEGREPICTFALGGGRSLTSPVTLHNDTTISCTAPNIPTTRESGHEFIKRRMTLALLLESNLTTFGFTEIGTYQQTQGRSTGDSVLLIDFPAIQSLRIYHEGQRAHETHTSIDLGAVERMDSSELVFFELQITDHRQFELAQLYGHDLKALVVATNGLTDYLQLEVQLIRQEDRSFLIANCSAEDVLANLTTVGEHRVGIAPIVEIQLAGENALRQLVVDDSPWFYLVDYRFLTFESIQETQTRLPVAPGLTNHITVDMRNSTEYTAADSTVRVGALGWDLETVLSLLSCAFLNVDETLNGPIQDIRLADLTVAQDTLDTLSPSTWDSGAYPDLLRVKFVFRASSTLRLAGAYCLKVVLNGQLNDYSCQDSDLIVEFYHLPPAIYSRIQRPCDIESELADYPILDRNFASQIAIIDGKVQYDREDGALLCSFDRRIYDFIHELYHLQVSELEGSQQRTLQDMLASSIAINVTDRALSSSSPKNPEDVFFRSHLLDLVDPYAPTMHSGMPSAGIYHPGENVTIRGYFLANSPLGVIPRLTSILDPSQVVRGTVICEAQSQYQTTCLLPEYAYFGAFGEFLVSLEEYQTGMLLSDDHSMVVLVVLPVPTILAVTQADVVATSQTELLDEGILRLQQLRVDFDWGEATPGTPELEIFRQNYLSRVRCRLGYLGPHMTANVTWSEVSQLSCYFEGTVPVVHPDDWCVEVSFNGGRTFTSDCPVAVASYRGPVQLDFEPKMSLISDPTTIVITGIGFEPLLRYWCLFTGPDVWETTTEAAVISATEVQCEKPIINSTEETHDFQIRLYFSPDWVEGESQLVPPLLAKLFPDHHRNQAYLHLQTVTPDRGDYLGGTMIMIALQNNPTALTNKERVDNLRCRFMSTVVGTAQLAYADAVFVDEDHLNCTTPDFSSLFQETWTSSSMEEVEISVSEFDGTFRARASIRYRYYRRPEILELYPPAGYASVETQVTLKGLFYVNFKDLMIRSVGVDSGLVQREWKAQDILYLDSQNLMIHNSAVDRQPSGKGRASQILFELSLNGGYDWNVVPGRDDAPIYTFLDEPQITSMSRDWSNLRAGFALVMDILHLGYDESCLVPAENYGEGGCGASYALAYCHIGVGTTPLTYINETAASCIAPSQHEVMAAPVALVTNGGHYFGGYSYHQPAILDYLDDTGIHELIFREGVHNEEVLVTLRGNYTALGDDEIIVNFGEVNATEIVHFNESHIIVRRAAVELPEGEDRQRVDVYLYWVEGGLLFRNASVQYQYKNYSILTGIWPERGPSTGGTIVEVRGIDLDQEAVCLLKNDDEELELLPLWVSKELILCETPSRKESVYSFELRWGGGAYETREGFAFEYDPDPHVLALTTEHVTVRAHAAGVRIGLVGWSFVDSPDFCVQIAGAVQPATYVNASFAVFSPPTVLEAGIYDIFLSNNGLDFSQASSDVRLQYHADFTVESLSVDIVQIANSSSLETVDIVVSGRGMPNSSATGHVDFYCVFAPTIAYSFREVIIRATLSSEDGKQVTCGDVPTTFVADGETEEDFAFNASLRFSYDLQEFLWDQPLAYYPAPLLNDVRPLTLTLSQSELVINVGGEGLVDSGDELKCRLRSLENATFIYDASLIAFADHTQSIQCTFALVPRGQYSLILSINGVQTVTAPDDITILAAIQIMDVEPPAVQSRAPGQVLLVQAENLVDGVWCVYEHLTPSQANHQVRDNATEGTRIGTHLLACPVPDLGGTGASFVNLRIALTVDDYSLRTRSQSAFALRVTDRCPEGFACLDDETTECSPGHQCPGGNLHQPQRRCPIGTFQDRAGAAACRPCPRGSICPFAAMQAPLPCPPGFLCGTQGLSSPSSECPEGHYCLAGGQGNEPFHIGLLSNISHLCTPGSFCKPGMRTGVVFQHSNTSAPAPCTHGSVCAEGSAEVGGVGACPAGSYCPTPRHSGIPCPPRHHCPKRGNTVPLKCPRGTFNMHMGQLNCTACTLGRICPLEGLFLPHLCPAGYTCNEEGLVYPENVCKVGHICLQGVMSGTYAANRSCEILKNIDGTETCGISGAEVDNIAYKAKDKPEYSAQALPAYFFERTQKGTGKADACCWNSTHVASWIAQIGKAVGQERAYRVYHDAITAAKIVQDEADGGETMLVWDGMTIVDKAVFNSGLDFTDGVNVPSWRHRQTIALYMRMMYTSHQAELCPGGQLCLDGVNQRLNMEIEELQNLVVKDLISSVPYPCPAGSFCLTASDSVIGTALCPIGYYCPMLSTYPRPAMPGYKTANEGALFQQPCTPGYFRLEWRSEACDACPSGYQCVAKGTSMPVICPVGKHRSVTGSGTACALCPKGTYGFERGAKDPLECQECPPGRICPADGSSNVSSSVACTDGQVCRPGTGAKSTVECPTGYYCPPETSEDTKFDQRCGAGFFCLLGTGESTKTRDTCPQSYYCPPGTGAYGYASVYSDYSKWATDAPTRCPQGTGLDGEDRKSSLLDCTIDADYRLLNSDLNLRVADTIGSTSTARLLQASAGRRQLAVASKSDPRLQDLFEVEWELGDYRDKPDLAGGIRAYITVEREYTARWSPLKLDLLSEFLEIEAMDAEQLETNSPNAIFDLPPSSYAFVTLDLRHLPDETYDWTYGEDWAISFTLSPDLTLGDVSRPTVMPEQFLSRNQPKTGTLEFTVFAWRHLRLRVDILCYNALYLNYRQLFLNTTSVEVRSPFRAIYGTGKIFTTSIVNDYEITLPFNQPKLLANWDIQREAMPADVVSFSQQPREEWGPVKHRSTKGRNVWVPTSLYWNSRVRINLPFLPYFSNCKGYGNIIPFWSLMEQHYNCALIPREETVFMTEYSFGQAPTADSCEEVVVNCVYDEVFVGQQPLPRWFEVDAGTPIFEVSTDPVRYDELMTKDFVSIEVLAVASPDNPGGEDGEVPKTVAFDIMYYQVDDTQKRLVSAALDFGDIEALNDDELTGRVLVDYNLTFSFMAMTHRDLTIAFAFRWHFYLVLYLIVGVLSLMIMVAFLFYHRLVARPDGGVPVANYKFRSFLLLTIPPAAEGTTLAIAPVIVADFLIAAIITARVFYTDTRIFECTEPDGDVACPLTIFDVVKDDPGAVSVDYTLLRTGRCGTSLLAVGLYLMRAGMIILIPDHSDPMRVPEAHDGNTWEYYAWKRSNMIYASTFTSFLLLAIIQFSFSDLFGERIWFSIAGLKVLGIGVDYSLEATMDEVMLAAPLSMCVIVILGLVTFGADDFLDFLNAFFIELGIMMFERTYLGEVVGMVIDYLAENVPIMRDTVLGWFATEEEGVVDDAVGATDGATGEAGAAKPNASEDSSNSEVFYSEEDSGDAGAAEELNDEDPDLILGGAGGNSDSGAGSGGAQSADLQRMEDADVDKADLERRQKDKNSDAAEDEAADSEEVKEEGEEDDEEDEEEAGGGGSDEEDEEADEEEQDVDLDEDAKAQEVEDLIGEYAGYSNDTLALLYTPIFVALLWMFYEETVVAKLYGIRVQDFVFYFLFSLVILPFQVVIDIWFLNIQEWYHYRPIHDYLDYMAFRYATRKSRWKGSEGFVNKQVQAELQSLDQMCFSAQHYFVQTLYVSGMTQVVLGIQVLLWAEGYNVFADLGTLPVVLSTIAMCVALEKACMACGRCFSLWKIDESVERLEGHDDAGDLARLFRQVEDAQAAQETDKQAFQPPTRVQFHARQWRLIEQARTDEDQLKNELASDRVAAQTFRDIFLTYNRPWLQGQLHEVFTPRTLFLYRKDIIDQFAIVMGEIQADVSLSDGAVGVNEEASSTASSGAAQRAKERATKAKNAHLDHSHGSGHEHDHPKDPRTQDFNDRIALMPAIQRLIKYWLIRMRFVRTLRVQVQAIVDLNLEEECIYCSARTSISVELLQSIEDLFNEYLLVSGDQMHSYKYQRWIRFFKSKARYRTLCVDCAEMIQDYHYKQRRKERRQAQARGEDPTKWTPHGGYGTTSQTRLAASHGRSTMIQSQSQAQRSSLASRSRERELEPDLQRLSEFEEEAEQPKQVQRLPEPVQEVVETPGQRPAQQLQAQLQPAPAQVPAPVSAPIASEQPLGLAAGVLGHQAEGPPMSHADRLSNIRPVHRRIIARWIKLSRTSLQKQGMGQKKKAKTKKPKPNKTKK